MKSSRLLKSTALFVVMLACAEAKSPLEPITVPDRALDLLPPGASGTLGINSSNDPSATASLPTYAEQLIAELRVHGYININSQHESKGSYRADP